MEHAKASAELRLKLIDSCNKDADKTQCRALLIKLDKFWPEYTDHLKTFHASRFQLGEVLHDLRDLTSRRGNGQWGKYAEAIGISSSTAKDLIADYKRLATLELPKHVHQAIAEMGLDIAKKKYAQLLELHAPVLRKSESKTEARTALQQVRDGGKRKLTAKTQGTLKSSSEFIKGVIAICNERWKMAGDKSEMLQLLESLATLYGLAPIELKAYRSVEEVPRQIFQEAA
jgi:hypothetical protein